MSNGWRGPDGQATSDVPGRFVRGAGKLARRYAAFLVGVLILVIVLLFIPAVSTRAPTQGSAYSPSSLPPGITAPAQPGSPGTAVSGVRCAPGVRQVPWSHYAPICEPAWTGNNGASTSPGVTAKTITITYRQAASSTLQLLYSLVPKSVIGTNAEVLRAMQAYVKLFNKEFELYGRKVVLKSFPAQGDFVNELNGGGASAAQADAVTAHSLGAFADVSIIDSTPIYDQALASQHIISFSPYSSTRKQLAQFAPYQYSFAPDCERSAAGTAAVIGKEMAGMPAIFAGDAAMRHKKRVFGVLYPSIPSNTYCTQLMDQILQKKYGVKLAKVISYSLNLSQASSQAATIVSEFKAAGVTTVICATCDFVTPIFLTSAANIANYHPEWIANYFMDAFSRLPNQAQWSHAVALGMQEPPATTQEGYKAFFKADPTGKIVPSFPFVYESMLLLFDGLQAAGPDLTPQTFAAGVASLPPSTPGGMFGAWRFGKGIYDPSANFRVVWWNPNAISGLDGHKGAWLNCNAGKSYSFYKAAASLPAHTQLRCFGAS